VLPEFLKRWLDPRLDRKIGIKSVRYHGWQHLWRDAASTAQTLLESPEVIGVVALLDLYGPTVFPRTCHSVREKYEWGVEHMQRKVNDPRFLMSFAVHETEAWLLSDPEVFPSEVRGDLLPLSLRPEEVDGDRPPSHRLDAIYERRFNREYKKVVYGQQYFRKLEPEQAAARCPYLKSLLVSMLEMARSAGA
jgi:hypothetical protein